MKTEYAENEILLESKRELGTLLSGRRIPKERPVTVSGDLVRVTLESVPSDPAGVRVRVEPVVRPYVEDEVLEGAELAIREELELTTDPGRRVILARRIRYLRMPPPSGSMLKGIRLRAANLGDDSDFGASSVPLDELGTAILKVAPGPAGLLMLEVASFTFWLVPPMDAQVAPQVNYSTAIPLSHDVPVFKETDKALHSASVDLSATAEQALAAAGYDSAGKEEEATSDDRRLWATPEGCQCTFVARPIIGGVSLLSGGDLIGLPFLASKLKQPGRAFDNWLADQFSPATTAALADYQGQGSDPAPVRQALVQEFNRILQGVSFYEQQRFQNIPLRSVTKAFASRNPKGSDLERLNRLLLEDAYPLEVARNLNQSRLTLETQVGDGDWDGRTLGFDLAGKIYMARFTWNEDRCLASVLLDVSFEELERSWPPTFAPQP